MPRLRMVFVVAAVAFSLSAAASQAATIRTVTDPGNAGTGTLRGTMALSGAGDTVLVPGSFTITLATPLPVTQAAPGGLTIAATGGGVPTITGAGVTSLFAQSSSTALTLDGFSLTGGNAGGGGGNVLFSGASSFLTIRNSNVSGNGLAGPSGDGGAIHMDGPSTMTIQTSTFANNHAGSGTGNGGAIQLNSPSNLTVSDSTFSDNSAGAALGSGGAIQMNGAATANIVRSLFSGNTSGNAGGALQLNSPATFNSSNNTFFNNAATNGDGGAVKLNSPANGLILNTTVAGNRADAAGKAGGGIRVGSDPANVVRLQNTIISGNTSPTGSNCGPVTPPLTSLGHNLEQGTTCGFTAAGDLNADPGLDSQLHANGGPTSTLALLPGSIAIDSGDNNGCPATDQRGQLRPINGNTGRGTVCDIGAFEYVPPALPDTVNPVASALKLAPSSFGALSSGGSVIAKKKKRKRAKGTNVSYTLSEAATTAFTIERKAKGRKKGKKCVSGRKKGKRCTKFKLLGGSFSHKGVAGSNSLRFSGRLNGKKLKPGSYRLTGVPTDAAGNHGKPVTASFKIVR